MIFRVLALITAILLPFPSKADAAVLRAFTNGVLSQSSSIDGTGVGGSGFELTGIFDTASGSGIFPLLEIVVTVDDFGDVFIAPKTGFDQFRIYFVEQSGGIRVGFGDTIGGWFLTYGTVPPGFDTASPSPGTFSGPVANSFAENSSVFPTLGQGPFQFGVQEEGIGSVDLAPVPVPASLPLFIAALAALGFWSRPAHLQRIKRSI